MVTRRNWAQRARYHRRGRRRQELKDEATYTLQHLAWRLAAAGRELELVELALGLREDCGVR